MRRWIMGSGLLILVLFASWFFVLPRVLPHLHFIPQTVYYNAVDDLHAFRVYTEYTARNGVDVYAEALRGGRRLGNMWLGRHNKPFDQLKFQTVTADSMAALVPQEDPYWILILIDLQTSETSRPRPGEGWGDRYTERVDRLLSRFRASTGESRYKCLTSP